MSESWLIEVLLAIAAFMNIEWRVPAAIVEIESGWDSAAVGASGEIGLMQIMPREAGDCFSDRPPARLLLNPVVNLFFGCSILRDNLRYFDGDWKMALAAYNLGIAGVEKLGIDDPAAARYLERFVDAWQYMWPGEELPWSGGGG